MVYTIDGISSSGKKIVISASKLEVADWIVSLDIEPAEFYHGGEAGNCFEASLILLMHATRHEDFEPHRVRLCHGVCNIRDSALVRGAHAWVEFLDNKDQWWVIDATAVGMPIRVSTQQEFYSRNMVKADCVDYYLPKEIVALANLHGESLHCGPWREPRDSEHSETFTCEFVL